jgi:hypothetical protein
MNPLSPNTANLTFSEGNLKLAGWDIGFFGTMGVSSGKWYWEMHSTNASGNAYNTSAVGIVHSDALYDTVDSSSNDGFQLYGGTNKARGYYGYAGNKLDASSNVSYGDAFVTGDIIGVALNLDDGEITFYKNNVSQGVAFTSLGSGEWFPLWQNWTSSVGVMNFGQDSSFSGIKTAQGNQDGNDIGDFYYTPPTGFLALCTKNLPDATVTPSEHFNTVLYTGNGGTNVITGVGFQSDWTWIKQRSNADSHVVFDAVRGVHKRLVPDSTAAEADWTSVDKGLDVFSSDGFTVKDDSSGNYSVNKNSGTFVAWNWKANGSGSSNTNGTITSTVSANVDAGFSIVGYTGNQTAGATVGHGLSKAPEMIITKSRAGTTGWLVGHNSLPNWSYGLALNTTAATWSENPLWNSTAPDATKFTLGSDTFGNSSNTRIAYCFHSVDGYSKVGSYIGNDNADGTFVYTGFRVAFLLLKNTAVAGEGFVIINNKSDPNNPTGTYLEVFGSSAEQGTAGTTFSRSIDFLSNGFKLRGNSTEVNDGETMVYYAIAETPFKYSNAR